MYICICVRLIHSWMKTRPPARPPPAPLQRPIHGPQAPENPLVCFVLRHFRRRPRKSPCLHVEWQWESNLIFKYMYICTYMY